MLLTSLIDLTGTAGWIAILTPFVLLAIAIVIGLRGRGSRPEDHDDVGGGAPSAVTAPGPEEASTDATDRGMEADELQSAAPVPPVAATLPAPTSAPPPAAPEIDEDSLSTVIVPSPVLREPEEAGEATSDIERQIAAAEERYDESTVAKLCISMAQELRARGDDTTAAATHLRRAVIIAMRLEAKETHAVARRELGDIAAENGDTTTACEHWQIARRIFWEGGASDRVGEMDRRMVALGCPTDWVLTDF